MHSSGKLFQQYIVDSYVKTEGSSLNMIRNNLKDFRIKLFSGLLDALRSLSENKNLRIGKFIILPSTFHGRARYMQQNCHDAMAKVQEMWEDWFIYYIYVHSSLTWNTGCHRKPENGPDILVQVFSYQNY